MNNLILFIPIFLALNGCIPDGPHKPLPGQNEPVQPAAIGYDSVRPLFANYCSACHPSRSGPDWLDYSQAEAYAQNGKLLQRILIEKTMPPPGSPQSAAITENQRRAIAAWARAGGPQQASGQPVTQPAAGTPASEADKPVRQCIQCHGTVTTGPAPQTKFPRLAGQNESYLVSELQQFKWRQRLDPSQSMNDIASDLSDADIEAVAKYYAHTPVMALSSGIEEMRPADKALFEYGRLKAMVECNSCHANPERSGRPLNDAFPVIAGQSKKYLINQLIYFRAKQRPGNIMLEMAKDLSNRDIEALATYFSSL